ncbi:MAG: hypothetical protein WD402_10610 [Chloroflexota bacterium]
MAVWAERCLPSHVRDQEGPDLNPEIKRYLDEHGATYTPDALHKGHVGGVGAALVGVLLVPVYGILMFGGCLAAVGIANRGG